MPDWQGRWTPRGLEPTKRTGFEKYGEALICVVIALGLVVGFNELRRHGGIKITLGDSQEQAAAIPQPPVAADEPPAEVPDPPVTALSPAENQQAYEVPPRQIQQASSPRRSVQQEYELASQIMESTANENRQARIARSTVRTAYGTFPDQLSFDYWWLNSYEQACLGQGRGSINYRDCRATMKEQYMNECRDRKLKFEGLSSSQRELEQPINEAQCYAANNYRIVE